MSEQLFRRSLVPLRLSYSKILDAFIKIHKGGLTKLTQNQHNISSKSAFTRFMLGSIMTAYGTVRLMRDEKSRKGQMLVLLGSMTAAEGATKFCATKAMVSNTLQNMMNENASQGASANAGSKMNSQTQSGQHAASGSTGQVGGNIKQMVGNIAPQVGKMMNSMANMAESPNASGANNVGKQEAAKNTTNSEPTTKSASATSNTPKTDGAANKSIPNVDTSIIIASSKTTDKNTSAANPLQ